MSKDRMTAHRKGLTPSRDATLSTLNQFEVGPLVMSCPGSILLKITPPLFLYLGDKVLATHPLDESNTARPFFLVVPFRMAIFEFLTPPDHRAWPYCEPLEASG
jgi:hypothetical protein